MTMVSDDYVGRVVESGSDSEMGRWSYVRMLGKHGRHIVVVSVYQVCNQQENTAGDRTAFAQQVSLLRRNGKDCPETSTKNSEQMLMASLGSVPNGTSLKLSNTFTA
jgi:hypothetical protein